MSYGRVVVEIRFAQEIKREAAEQRALQAAGEVIPASMRVYARKAGLAMGVVSGSGSGVIAALGYVSGKLYILPIALFAVFAVIGVAQLITGRHLVSGGRG